MCSQGKSISKIESHLVSIVLEALTSVYWEALNHFLPCRSIFHTFVAKTENSFRICSKLNRTLKHWLETHLNSLKRVFTILHAYIRISGVILFV